MPDPIRNPDDKRRYSNALRLQSEGRLAELSQQLIGGDIDVSTWQLAMKDELRRAAKEQLVIGKGGVLEDIKASDWLALGPELRRQYTYLDKFGRTVVAAAKQGKPLGFVESRAKLYGKAMQAVFWKTAIPVRLPQVPRDGSTACRTNCKCRLRYEDEYQDNVLVAVKVWWKLSPAEHCDDCLRLGREWNPKRFVVETSEVAPMTQGIDLLLQETPDLRPHRLEIYRLFGLEEAL